MKFLSQINVNSEYTLPIVDGTNGQVLTTDGNGAVYWSSSVGATNLNALTDVELTSPSTGQILRYEIPLGGSVPVWRNVTPGYLDPNSSINALGDVTITSAVAGQILQFNGTFWINTTLSTVEYVSKVQHTVKAGVAITKGQAVYVTTSDGTNMIVGLASNAAESTSSKVIGLAASNAATNDQIFVVTEGLLAGLNTSTATAGDPVWLGTNGNLIFGLLNKPVAPAHLVYIGVVTRVQSNNGEIFVNVQNGFELNEIHDALIVSPTAGQLLRRDSDNLWKNWTPNFLTAHPTIANGGSVDNSNGTVIQDITLETNGHVTAITSVDLDTRYYTQNDISGIFGGEIPMAGYNPTNWDAAYGWGNHASAGYATTSYVTTAIANLVDSAPSTLDTLNELAAALGDDPNFATTVTNNIAGKVSKYGESHDSVLPNTLGAGQGGFYTVASGYGPSGGNDALIHIPYAINDWAHQIAMDWATGDSQDMWFRTKHNGTWQAWKKVWHDGNFTDNSSNWNTAYGWGNHALAGYATQTWVGLNYYNSGQIDDFFSGAEAISGYNKSNWDAAYNDKVNSASFNTTNGVLTLTQQDGGTVTVDLDGRYLTSDTDAQTLTWEAPTKNLSITNGNTVTLEGLATEDYVLSQGFISSESDTLASVTGRGNTTTTGASFGGNVGIGTTSPNAKLVSSKDVSNNDFNNLGAVQLKVTGSTNYNKQLLIGFETENNYGFIQTLEDGASWSSYNLAIQPKGGNVGIGTTSPNRNLTVSGNGTLLGIQSNTVGGYSEIEMTANGVSAGYIFKASAGFSSYAGAGSLNIYNSGSIGFHTASATNAMFIASATGNVGIGNTNPTAKLQVGPEAHPNATGIEVAAGVGGANLLARDSSTHHNWFPYTNGDNYYSAGAHHFRSAEHGTPWVIISASDFTWGGNTVATRAWVQAQGYLTSETDSQTLAWDAPNKNISISNGNTVTLDGLATEEFVTSQGYITGYTETDTLSTVTARGGSTGSLVVLYGKVSLGNNTSGTYNGNVSGLTLNSTAEIRSTSAQNPPALTWHYEGLATRHLLMTSGGALNFVSPSNEASGVAVVQVNGNNIWHAGNDGSGSGLDADLWDGYHIGQFSNWNSRGANDIVTGMLSWRNYGSNHVIFDASSGVSPSGTAVNNSNPDVAWSGSYPTLMGWNGSNTYGVRVHNAYTADTLGGLDSSNFIRVSANSSSPLNANFAIGSASGRNFIQSHSGQPLDINPLGNGVTIGAGVTVSGVITATGGNSTNWNSAYSWGNHADAPYWNVSLNQNIQVESQQVTFAGDVVIQGTLTESSSIRFKENITPLDPALDKVNQLEAVSYNKIGVDDREIGLIAEDVAELFPEVVTYNEEGQPQGIQYQRLSVILLKALQELSQEVNELKKKLN